MQAKPPGGLLKMYCVHVLFVIGISCVTSLSIPLNDTSLVSSPGFSTKIEFGNEPLNPIGVYINAIDALKEWSKNAWNSEFKGTIGEVYDPNPRYHWLSIDWRFDGRTILASEIFTTIIDAMISTTSEKPDAQRPYIYGVSSSGNTAFNIHTLTYVPQGARELTNDLIRESLYLIARFIFIKERKFLETEFTVLSFRKKIAGGFFMKIGDVRANQTVPTAFERRDRRGG
ncbi:MAG: hypothetical protein Q9191_006757 [Dirinaria sp. TL-2023a]